MSQQTLSSYIVTKVRGIAGVASAYVYDYEEPKMVGWPTICVTVKESSAKFLTNTQNQENYIFTIRIYQEMNKNNLGISKVDSNLRALADNIITAFNNDNRLGGNAVYSLPVMGKPGYVQDQPIRTWDIELTIIDVVTATG